MADKCAEIVQRISSSSGQELVIALQDLSALLNSPSYSLRELAPHIPAYLLFGCLNTKNEEQILLSKGILKKLLSVEKADALITHYHDFVIEGLNHPVFDVRELCLSELERCSSSMNGLLALLDNVDVLVYTSRALSDENLSCAKLATKTLVNTAKHESGLELLFQHQIQSELEALLMKKDVIRFRVYELIVIIQALSDRALECCKRSGVLEKLTKELDGDDVLLRLNCLELLTQMADSGKNGLMFVDEGGIVTRLNNMLLSAEADPLMSLMLPSIIRFFGYLAQSRPTEVTQQYPAFLLNVFSFLTADDPALKLIAIQTIGAVSYSEAGLRVVFDNQAHNDEIMKILCSNIKSSQADIKSRSLEALSSIFYSANVPSDDLSEVTRSLFTAMASNPLQVLVDISKQPFQDVHCAVLRVFKSLAKYKWAQQDMTTSPGFLEYLMDRTTETDKAGKEQKYEFIVELVRSPFSKEVFKKPFHLRLREYEREGPFYVRAQAAVAFEGAD